MGPISNRLNEKPKMVSECIPLEEAHEFDVVAFKKTDRSRDVTEGSVGTIVDLVDYDKYGYTVETNSGDTERFYRHEFRLATPEDIARHRATTLRDSGRTTHQGKSSRLPKMPISITRML